MVFDRFLAYFWTGDRGPKNTVKYSVSATLLKKGWRNVTKTVYIKGCVVLGAMCKNLINNVLLKCIIIT